MSFLTKVELVTPLGFNLTLDTATGDINNKIALLGVNVDDNINGMISRAKMPLETFDKTILDQLVRGTEVKVWLGEELNHKFTGYLIDRPKNVSMLSNVYELSAIDYTGRLQEILVNESYEEKTISYIVNDLITRYTGFAVNIENNDSILSITFKEKFLFDCLESIAEAIGWNFKVDKDKIFNFYSEDSIINSNVITDEEIVPGSLDLKPQSNIVNRLWVKGGYRASNDHTQKWSADGNTNIFPFNYSRVRASSQGKIVVKVDGNEVQTGTKYVDSFDNPDIMALININDRHIETRNNPITSVEAIYKYEYPIRLLLEDLDSQAKYGVIDDKLEVDSNDEDFVRKTGQMYLDKHREETLSGNFKVWEGYFNAGELVRLKLDDHNIDQYLKITSVNYNSSINNLDITIQVENIKDDADLVKDIIKRLQRLEQSSEDENAIVEKLLNVNSKVNVGEEISIYQHTYNMCGTIRCGVKKL